MHLNVTAPMPITPSAICSPRRGFRVARLFMLGTGWKAFTQKIGVSLAGLRKFDNWLGDDSIGEIVCNPERHASHFECDAHDPLGLVSNSMLRSKNGLMGMVRARSQTGARPVSQRTAPGIRRYRWSSFYRGSTRYDRVAFAKRLRR